MEFFPFIIIPHHPPLPTCFWENQQHQLPLETLQYSKINIYKNISYLYIYYWEPPKVHNINHPYIYFPLLHYLQDNNKQYHQQNLYNQPWNHPKFHQIHHLAHLVSLIIFHLLDISNMDNQEFNWRYILPYGTNMVRSEDHPNTKWSSHIKPQWINMPNGWY